MRRKNIVKSFLNLTLLALALVELSCSSESLKNQNKNNIDNSVSQTQTLPDTLDSQVIQKKELDAYKPRK